MEELLLLEKLGNEEKIPFLLEDVCITQRNKLLFALDDANIASRLKLLVGVAKETAYNEENNSGYSH
jgi:hypothetical protein